MPATALDSAIFRDIFSTPAMRQVFSDENRTACYLAIEAALARVQGRLGIIPANAAREIERQCKVENIDFGKLKQTTERIGYPILGVVQQIVALCEQGLGEWCHWGATTQDITDTATIMQIRSALALVEADMEKVAAALLAAMQRHRARLAELRPRVLVGEFAGAAGTLSSLGAHGLKVQEALMVELGLGQPEIAWHTVRDRIGEVGCFLGLVTGTLGKLSMDVKLMMQTEVAEVFEPFHEGRGSSSTMPQKRNPISCLYIHATAALVRQHVAALLESAVADHDRSTGPWQIEWIALPEIFLLASGALAQSRRLLDGICRRVAASGKPLLEELAKNPEISRHLSKSELAKLTDPKNYLGLAGPMIDRVLALESKHAGRK